MKKIIALALFALFLNQASAACLKEAARNADYRWADAVETQDPATVNRLYAHYAVLLATYENKPITNSKGRLNYFNHFLHSMNKMQVHYNQEIIQTFPGGAVSSGLYTFSGEKDGKPVSVPARFTFVYQNTAKGCQLITHHSSTLPK